MTRVEPSGPDFSDHELKLYQTAKLAEDLFAGLLGFHAALALIADDRILGLVPPVLPGQFVPTGSLTYKSGQLGSTYHFTHYLDHLRSPQNREAIERLWASNALIRLGQELSRYGYFDRDPCFELVRHLRNAVAHGERFLISSPKGLLAHPAHLAAGLVSWEITPALNGVALYDFVAVGDIASIIQLVGIHLNNMALDRHVER